MSPGELQRPLRFTPRFLEKPWGGRRLADVLGKDLPPDVPIGEAWELASLPEWDSHIAEGARDGTTLGALVRRHGRALLGLAAPVDGRFPLLLKFLDARDHLSVQVHPKPHDASPTADFEPGVKHEAWYIIDAEPGAELFIGLRPGVSPAEVAAAADTPRMRDLLARRPARAGDCHYLPSGTLHALGAGIVVAEVQTPSDVTYRMYDWDRTDAAGRPRALHIAAALANIRFDVAAPPLVASAAAPVDAAAVRVVCDCPRFLVREWRLPPETAIAPDRWAAPDRFRCLMVIAGSGVLRARVASADFFHGQTWLLPVAAEVAVRAGRAGVTFLEVVPAAL